MAVATISFWGSISNSYGIPSPFYSYLVTVSVNQAIANGSKIVKITPINEETPKPSREHPFVIKNSDCESAIREAYNLLSQMPCLQGLKNKKTVYEI